VSARERVARWVRPQIRALTAYHVPDPGKAVKLDAMENPYRLPPELVEAWLERLRGVPLNRYPDPAARALRERLRRHLGLGPEVGILFGNGSDELIQIFLLALAGPDRVVLAPEPSFVMYRMIAQFAGLRYVGVPLRRGDFGLDMEAMLAAIEAERPAVVFLAWPNNPTGNRWPRGQVERIIEAAPGLVVVDEAYAPFAEDSFLSDAGRWDNLVVMRTFSKQGLAGLRLGYALGAPEWIAEFDKLRLPYNINALTQASAAFALEHMTVFDEQAARIRAERARLHEALAAVEGVEPYPSETNFILFRVPAGRGRAVFEGVRARGVLIKDLSAQPGLEDCLRVTVGLPEENDAFLRALSATLRALAD
jgi:histidinol-phosphate aminotransferase